MCSRHHARWYYSKKMAAKATAEDLPPSYFLPLDYFLEETSRHPTGATSSPAARLASTHLAS